MNFESYSVAFTEEMDKALVRRLDKGCFQEDLTFAYWRPSYGASRLSGLISQLAPPRNGERILQGNVAFTEPYLHRVLAELPSGCGLALLHSHLGPGWQEMSDDDIIAERDRLAGPAWGRSRLPLLGLTWGTDGTWSARFWMHTAPKTFVRSDASTVRVVGDALRISYDPRSSRPYQESANRVATISAWGQKAQKRIENAHIGIIGLGSVGSIANELLARTGATRITLLDHDRIETRNLDRTIGARQYHALMQFRKVTVARKSFFKSSTAQKATVRKMPVSLCTKEGIKAALDCDILLSCVDRPFPRYLLNLIAYSHLIPVVDGGILARVKADGSPLHVDWRIHRVGPTQACMICLGALVESDAAMDRDGVYDDPGYIKGLSEAELSVISRRNVMTFSASTAAHQVLQLIGVITGIRRIGGYKPQMYHCYPGRMDIIDKVSCAPDCPISEQLATAVDLENQLRN